MCFRHISGSGGRPYECCLCSCKVGFRFRERRLSEPSRKEADFTHWSGHPPILMVNCRLGYLVQYEMCLNLHYELSWVDFATWTVHCSHCTLLEFLQCVLLRHILTRARALLYLVCDCTKKNFFYFDAWTTFSGHAVILTLAIFFQLELKCVWKMCRESRKPSVACITRITNTFPRPQHCDSRPHRHTATNTCVVTVANSELNVGYSNNNISANSKHIYMIFISF